MRAAAGTVMDEDFFPAAGSNLRDATTKVLDKDFFPAAGAVLLFDKPEASLGFWRGVVVQIWRVLPQLSFVSLQLCGPLNVHFSTWCTITCSAGSFHGQAHYMADSVMLCWPQVTLMRHS